MTKTPGLDTPSAEHAAMTPFWSMVDVCLSGADAVIAAGEAWLPKPPAETDDDYEYRRKNAKFTNVYADIVGGLAAKPFSEPVKLVEQGSTPELQKLAEDIDGRGNSLHVVAGEVFYAGLNYEVDWILVDYTRARTPESGRPLTQAEEKAQRLRPYWVRIPAACMIDARPALIGGEIAYVHARFHENTVLRDGYAEVAKKRIREFDRAEQADGTYGPATWKLWEQRKNAKNEDEWVEIDGGSVSIGVIALTPFITGRKTGKGRRIPPLKDALFLQREHYQQETCLKYAREMTAFPMLAGNGVQPAIEKGKVVPVPVGPKSVLYAPPNGDSASHGEWKFIEPSAESLKFLAEEVRRTEQQLRELGRQPLTAQSGNLTVVTTAFAAQKGNSAVQAWALNLKDALEQAFRYTAMWLKDETSNPVVQVFTDFDISMGDDMAPAMLKDMRAQGDISGETYRTEAKRRGVLSAEFDEAKEQARITAEAEGKLKNDPAKPPAVAA